MWFDPDFKPGFWLLHPGPCPDAVAKSVDGVLVPVKSLPGVDFNDSAFELGVPLHLSCLDGFEGVFVRIFPLHFILDQFHDVQVE